MKQIILSIRPAAYIQDKQRSDQDYACDNYKYSNCFRHTNNPFLICVGKYPLVIFILAFFSLFSQSIYMILIKFLISIQSHKFPVIAHPNYEVIANDRQ